MNGFVKNPLLQDEAVLQQLYTSFISTFETK